MDVDFEIEVDENQISFDFLNERKDETTKGDVETEPVQQAENLEWVAEETLVVLVKANGGIDANFDICGKKMIDWVSLATSGCKQKIIEDLGEEDLLSTLEPLAEGYNFVSVFYSDTPLLQKKTFLEIMDFFAKKQMNVLKLSRGYIFRAEFLQNAKMLLSSAVENFGNEDFVLIDCPQKVSYAFKVLNKRILNYHKERGVVFFGEETIFVDADVEIEQGSIIYPNNIIKGESYIGKNVVLESGNYIFDTIVCDEAFVCQSYLEKSKVEKGKVVGPFKRLINEQI